MRAYVNISRDLVDEYGAFDVTSSTTLDFSHSIIRGSENRPLIALHIAIPQDLTS